MLPAEPIQVPDNGINGDMEMNKEDRLAALLYKLSQDHKMTRACYNGVLNFVNNHVIPSYGKAITIACCNGVVDLHMLLDPTAVPIPSSYRIKKKLKENSKVGVKCFHSCVRGCMMYLDENLDETVPPLTECPDCHQPRYHPLHGSPNSYVYVASIGDILASKLYYPATRQQLLYRHVYSNNTDNMKDIFDGKVYQALVADGKFASQYDIAIGLSIDGFTFFDGSNFQGTMVNMIIFNIHPKQR